MSRILYEFKPTRSARVRWTMLELDLPFESRAGFEMIRSDEVRKINPMGKLPAFLDDGRPLFESAAICNWLADSHPEKGLVAQAGTWQRALHDQWVSFTLSELEAYIWSTARNSFVLPEDERVPEIIAQNDTEAKKALGVFNAHLAGKSFFIDDRFSLTDIFVGYTLNWAWRAGLADDFANVVAFNERLLACPNCTFMALDEALPA